MCWVGGDHRPLSIFHLPSPCPDHHHHYHHNQHQHQIIIIMITPCVDLAETNPPIYLGGSRSSDSQTASHPCSTMSRFVFVVFVFVFLFVFVFVFVFVFGRRSLDSQTASQPYSTIWFVQPWIVLLSLVAPSVWPYHILRGSTHLSEITSSIPLRT